jgi:ubiquinone/menaquinone biosynthesis C-methylase UbiE
MSTAYPIAYLDTVRGTSPATEYKQRTYVEVLAGQARKILDVGCGTGDDVANLARLVAPQGSATGVDRSPMMIAEAWRRHAGVSSNTSFVVGDAHSLEWPDESFDGVRCDRALQHMEEPAVAVGELYRVLRCGGNLVLAEPDYESTTVDCSDVNTTRTVIRRLTDTGVRHGWMGRRLPRICHEAGIPRVDISAFAFHVRELRTADVICSFFRHADGAAQEGLVTKAAAEAWKAELRWLDEVGIFSCCILGFMAVSRKPGDAAQA